MNFMVKALDLGTGKVCSDPFFVGLIPLDFRSPKFVIVPTTAEGAHTVDSPQRIPFNPT